MKIVEIHQKIGKFDFEWDKKTLNKQFFVQGKQITIKNSYQGLLAMMYPNFNKLSQKISKIQWGIKIIKKLGYSSAIGVGICSYNSYVQNEMIFDQGQQMIAENSIQIILDDGEVYSTSMNIRGANEFNQKNGVILYSQNDVFNVCYEPKKRILRVMKNKNQEQVITLTNLKNLYQNDFYVPCIMMKGPNVTVSIIQENQSIKWSDSQQKIQETIHFGHQQNKEQSPQKGNLQKEKEIYKESFVNFDNQESNEAKQQKIKKKKLIKK